MKTIEIFFDYACPYCYHGLEHLRDLLPEFPGTETVWYPCEAHPRPEEHGMHSDMAIQGFYFARENGLDAWKYNDRIFKAIFEEKMNLESPDAVAACLHDLNLSGGNFAKSVQVGKYEGLPLKNNRLAWEKYNFCAVPSYKMNDMLLESQNGVGVTKAQLKKLLCGR